MSSDLSPSAIDRILAFQKENAHKRICLYPELNESPEDSWLKKKAKKAIRKHGMKDDPVYHGGVGKYVLELLEVFEKQGHSQMSAVSTAYLFNEIIQSA